MAESLQKRRARLLREIGQIERMRRGQLSEQFYDRENAQGQRSRQGPYFVWQAWVKGKKRSIRVKREDVKQVREDMEKYRRYRQLCEELAEVTESLTRHSTASGSKKNSRKCAKRSAKS